MSKYHKWCTTMSCFALAILATSALIPCNSAPMLDRDYDWTMEIKTQQMPLHFEYRGSTLKPVVKTELSYYHKGDSDNKTLYEYLWFANGKSVGLDRRSKMLIAAGDGVQIILSHSSSSPTESERESAAKAIMRAVLDIEINRSMVATVRVPAESFSAVCSGIEEYNFHPLGASPGEEIHSDLSLFIESDAGQHETLYHFN